MKSVSRDQQRVVGTGSPDSDLTPDELAAIVEEAFKPLPSISKVLAIVPDKTRDDNTHILFPAAAAALSNKGVSKVDVLIAQGTHPPMSVAEKLVKIGADINAIPNLGEIYDHRWSEPGALVAIGELSADEVKQITSGLFTEAIPLVVNRLVADTSYDAILVLGATMPHEVAGFAGGAKYFFPGVAGPELTHKTHWLAALSTIENIIGRIETPTRHLIEAAADHIDTEIISFTSVVTRDDDELRTCALFAGDIRAALRAAAAVSSRVHIKYTGRKYRRVIALLDEHYDDLWVGGKASYRLGHIIELGGELIIYAPHLRCISDTHGEAIKKFGGYAPIEIIKDLVAASGELQANLCVAAHLAHVAFAGHTDSSGKVKPRYPITLASQVSREQCERVNLNYLDPNDFQLSDYQDNTGTFIVERAGRDLYLVAPSSED